MYAFSLHGLISTAVYNCLLTTMRFLYFIDGPPLGRHQAICADENTLHVCNIATACAHSNSLPPLANQVMLYCSCDILMPRADRRG